jgi:peroxiredoxin
MNIRVIFFWLFALGATAIVSKIFWDQEAQYVLPTKIPDNFTDVKIGQVLDLSPFNINEGKINMLHFYNPDCPCSRFNMMEFERIARKYKQQANVYVIIQSADERDVMRFNKKYELDIPVILDKDGVISDQCGIYSTPQSVLLNRDSRIYFKGNYNVARYCTREETSFAEMAMGYLLKDEPMPIWLIADMTMPYGCALPSDEPEQPSLFSSLFN